MEEYYKQVIKRFLEYLDRSAVNSDTRQQIKELMLQSLLDTPLNLS